MVTQKPKIVAKDWGKEVWLVNNEQENYCSKILEINAGQKSSMHFHVIKHETFYVQQGILLVGFYDLRTMERSEVEVRAGESLEIDRMQAHQLIAKDKNVVLLETSTFHREEDSYRVFR